MAISHKRKRKIKYKNNLYLWNIIKNDEHDECYLSIISDDKKLHLYYRINQISDSFVHPKITVLKSEKLEKGTHPFFPPIADEIITNHNVGAILNWYHNQENTVHPLVFEMPKNPFENIEFNSETVTHIENDFSKVNLK